MFLHFFLKIYFTIIIIVSTSLPLLFSLYLTLVLSSRLCPFLRPSFYLKLSGKSGRNCLLSSPVLLDYNGSPDTRFSRGATGLMSWPDGERYLRPLQASKGSNQRKKARKARKRNPLPPRQCTSSHLRGYHGNNLRLRI